MTDHPSMDWSLMIDHLLTHDFLSRYLSFSFTEILTGLDIEGDSQNEISRQAVRVAESTGRREAE